MRKDKIWEVDLFDQRPYSQKSIKQLSNPEFWTSDTEAFLVFKLFNNVVPDSATLNLYNRDDKSLVVDLPMAVNNQDVEIELTEEIIAHFGRWSAQAVFNIAGESHTSPSVSFTISRELGADLPERLGIIEEWKDLNNEVKSFVAEIEGFTLEQFVGLKMGEELANLEVNYATRLTGLETNDANLTAQLAQNTTMSTEDESAGVSTVDLIDGTGWTLGTGWTGDFASGFVHQKGQQSPLSKSINIVYGKVYEVRISVQSPTSSKESNSGFEFTLGDSDRFEMYEGNFTNHTYIRGVQAGNGEPKLIIYPGTQFDGTITGISIREIISTISTNINIRDKDNTPVFQINPTAKENENVFMGVENALFNTTGSQNVGIGYQAMRLNTTGFWNVAVGRHALQQNTVGSRNVALGYIALRNNKSGHRNISIGPFTLLDNISGHNNIALGADVLQRNIDGNHNIALGVTSISNSKSGTHNIGIGRGVLAGHTAIKNNIAIGEMSLREMSNEHRSSIAIGSHALRYSTEGRNTAIGEKAGFNITSAIDNIAIGNEAMMNNVTGERNLVIGNYSGGIGSTVRNLILGGTSGTSIVDGASYNMIIGHASGNKLTTGKNNVLIGYNVDVPSAQDSDILNIGNFLFGRMGSNKRFGIGVTMPLAKLHLPASDGSQQSAPIRINAGELLAGKEKGAIEYDGANLYLTNDAGVRHKLVMEVV